MKAQCNSNGFILTGSNGSFSSPNYPSDYPNSETCRWIISAPQGHLVQLNFQTFVLETCLVPLICSCDHVEVRDGSDANSPKLGKFCGNNKPAPIQSSGRYMWVEFDSDLTRNEKGFYATYIAVGNEPFSLLLLLLLILMLLLFMLKTTSENIIKLGVNYNELNLKTSFGSKAISCESRPDRLQQAPGVWFR